VKYLLDTHAIIWSVNQELGKLSANAESIIADANNQIYYSSASIWEIAIKISLGKLNLSFPNLLTELKKVGFTELHSESEYLGLIIELPQIHKDPFDRLLIATAKSEDMILLTTDENIQKYDVKWVW
jgi:PIN domain nuclease of toxin-antitoxin system